MAAVPGVHGTPDKSRPSFPGSVWEPQKTTCSPALNKNRAFRTPTFPKKIAAAWFSPKECLSLH
jgi:hypothetical protein